MNSPIKRTDNTLVPDSEELKVILEMEVTRSLPPEKEFIHYPNFKTIIALIERFGLPTEVFTDDSLDIYEVVDLGKDLTNRLANKVLKTLLTTEDIELFNNAYDYLSEEDIPEKSDLILVFGAKTPLRAKKAAEIYHKGLSNKILVSGSRPVYAKGDEELEADIYERILIAEGVKPKDIIKEDKAISLVDNVRRSLNLLDEIRFNYESLIVVNSPYTQRRGWVLLKKLLPDSLQISRVNCETGEPFKKENWFKQENTLKSILTEFIKMKASVAYNSA